MLYPWQYDDWRRIQVLREHWIHALLLHGQAGIGKMNFACELAQGLLCEQPSNSALACSECAACTWFLQRNHPDFRLVCPEVMTTQLNTNAHKNSNNNRISEDTAGTSSKKFKSLSKEIKIEQVRGLLDFCSISPHRGGRRVVILFPAEALNVVAANALLKTLEEPPSGVLFLLVSADVKRLPKTIVSRCRQWFLAMPNAASALDWLRSQSISNPAVALAEAGGAPLAALTIAHDGYAPLKRCLLEQLSAGLNCDPFSCCEALQKAPMSLVLGWLQRWIYDLLTIQMSGGEPRYFPACRETLKHLAQNAEPFQVAQCLKRITQQRAAEQDSLNSRLVFEGLFIYYRNIFRSKL
ncbi:DNA polymerase III subunit delta' [Candidatus Vallotia lariciata]|uniref:DNA polymerase III subunit delta' n=1 Tax=Candidatus Vallotia laricis TaxID=2018052 RepID=UPI001D00FA8C|nr:DNA polymerase III subunit delta' [Candidatus Vallotia lariciata]UDG83039.1 DNA polymerase III subunit delta' [Candidatus Vallotia lariciata]